MNLRNLVSATLQRASASIGGRRAHPSGSANRVGAAFEPLLCYKFRDRLLRAVYLESCTDILDIEAWYLELRIGEDAPALVVKQVQERYLGLAITLIDIDYLETGFGCHHAQTPVRAVIVFRKNSHVVRKYGEAVRRHHPAFTF